MRKNTMIVGLALVMVLAVCVNAYAGDGATCPAWNGFWNSVGGFFYNALPWNWGNWVGK